MKVFLSVVLFGVLACSACRTAKPISPVKTPTEPERPREREPSPASERKESRAPIERSDHTSIPKSDRTPTLPSPDLASLLNDKSLAMPEDMRRSWPGVEWKTARAYAFNFFPGRSPHDAKRPFSPRPWTDPAYSEDIVRDIPLSTEAALIAIELIHRSGGGLITTRCPLFIRHAIVFFDAENAPVGSMEICFECSDSVTTPDYFSNGAHGKDPPFVGEHNETLKWDVYAVYGEALKKWQEYFDAIGAPRYDSRKR
jgi:hypothetical protein